MKGINKLTIMLICLFMGGCATVQQPIPLTGNILAPHKSERVGVGMTALPNIDVYLTGADCLLCIAVAKVANSSLTKHAKTLTYEDLTSLKDKMGDLIRNKGSNVIVVTENIDIDVLSKFDGSGPNVAKYDFRPLKQKYGVDKLVIITGITPD